MTKKLIRNTQDKMIAGVASGLAQYFQLDVTWVRIAFALAAFFGGGGIWVYIILWIAVPEEVYNPFQYTDYRVNPDDPKAANTYSTAGSFSDFNKPKSNNNFSAIAGFVLIVVGGFLLLNEFNIIPNWFSIKKLWPLVIVGIGLSILIKSRSATKNNPFDTSEFTNKTTEETKSESNPVSNNATVSDEKAKEENNPNTNV